jgi:hypothetical protein
LVLLLAYREELTDPMPGLGGDESGAEASVIRESFQIWYEPVRRVPGGPSDPERDAAVVLATVKVSADGRVGARGIERGGRRGSGRSS